MTFDLLHSWLLELHDGIVHSRHFAFQIIFVRVHYKNHKNEIVVLEFWPTVVMSRYPMTCRLSVTTAWRRQNLIIINK